MGVLDRFLDAIRLNDDEDGFLDDDLLDEEDDEFLDEEEDLKPKKRFLDRFQKRAGEEDFDEDEEDEIDEIEEKPSKPLFRASKQPAAQKAEPKEERTVKAPSKITPMRSSRRAASGSSMEVCVVKPTSMENTREIADLLVNKSTVILNLEGIDVELAQRIIDFTSGACYSLKGTLQKVSSYIFVLGPAQVEITGDLQSILGGEAPSVRAGY